MANHSASTITSSSMTGWLELPTIEKIAKDLIKCVKKDQLVKAKLVLKGTKKDDRRRIVNTKFDGNAALFLAAQQGLVHIVNYLLDECQADIELRGVYEVQEDRSRHQVTPLWCAAVANKLEVVKTLIKHNADVNATSDTQSTPVRSACYMTNIDVVKYLVDSGADIHKPNMNGGTCLINSVQNEELCRFLIKKGASVNAQDNSGNLALHYAIREGRMETVKLLMSVCSNPYVCNDFGDDAIQTACLRGYADILDFLLSKIKPSLQRQIEAYELMAANFVDEKHDIQGALQNWRHAMELRVRDPENKVNKTLTMTPNKAYLFQTEACSTAELDDISASPDCVYMQALLVRERILGPDHKDTIFGLMYRGAVYADTHKYQRCVDLWKYGFHLRHRKEEAFNHECLFTFQALCKLFWEIYEEHNAGFTNECIRSEDVMEVFGMAVRELELAQAVLEVRPVHIHHLEDFHTILLLVLHLIHLLSYLLPAEEQLEFRRLVHSILRRKPQGKSGKTLLHLAVDSKSSNIADEFYSILPRHQLVKVLLECGADINALDEDHNMPLHICMDTMPTLLDKEEGFEMEKVVSCLLEHGAHVDAINKAGVMAGRDVVKSWCKLRVFDHITLKCLAAHVLQRHKIPYADEVPESLISFIEMH